ncbi:MAG: hypothetical protein HQL42_16460 [Alphaproteobacteria bacterium]|nr:hypothetical protein [Alphaproteobacteria bacterium]
MPAQTTIVCDAAWDERTRRGVWAVGRDDDDSTMLWSVVSELRSAPAAETSGLLAAMSLALTSAAGCEGGVRVLSDCQGAITQMVKVAEGRADAAASLPDWIARALLCYAPLRMVDGRLVFGDPAVFGDRLGVAWTRPRRRSICASP